MFNTNPWLYYSATSNKLTNTYIQGILDICGNIVLRNGGLSLPNGDVSMNGNLYVGLDTTMMGNVNIQGNLVVNKRVLQTLSSDPSYNSVNGYYALDENVQPIVSKQTAYDIGQNWQSAVSGVIGNNWYSVCWSSELGLFCAVANSGTTNQRVMISSNGLNWRNALTGVLDNSWNHICWSPELGKFCTVGTGNVMVSSDGLNWTNTTSGVLNYNWINVCWSPELNLFCSICSDIGATNQKVMISNDGLNWSNSNSGVLDINWWSVCWSPELGIFCAVGVGYAMISRDGLNWINSTNGIVLIGWRSICWSPQLGIFCAVSYNSTGNNTVMISSDGLNWRNATSGVLNNNWCAVCWSPELGLFCSVAYTTGTTNQKVMISNNGLNWRNATRLTLTITWNQVCWSPELSSFCAVGQSGTTNERVMITNQEYRLPTTKTLQTLLNDGNYNINIPSTTSETFPNFRTIATGPNLINIGNGNYKLVAGALRDSIAIGNTILNTNPTGYGIIGMGQNVFPVLTTGFQNIGIGNAIATSMTTGYNNVFIGNSVATSTSSTGNTVAIGTNAGRTNTTGINNTYLGAFSGASSGTYSNSTALGFGATIDASNEIVLGTLTEHIRTPGNPYWAGGLTSISNSANVSNVVAFTPSAATTSNRITIYNTYFLVLPEFAYGVYQVNLVGNPDKIGNITSFALAIFQFSFPNATVANMVNGTPTAVVNYNLWRIVQNRYNGATTVEGSASITSLFEYAPGTQNRAFSFAWGANASCTVSSLAQLSWITIHKIA